MKPEPVRRRGRSPRDSWKHPAAALWPFLLTLTIALVGPVARADHGDADQSAAWLEQLLPTLPSPASGPDRPSIVLLRQDYEQLERNRSNVRTPLIIGARTFDHGLGTHSVSHIRITSPEPIDQFEAWVGVDNNAITQNGQGSIVFSVSVADRELFRSPRMRGGDEPCEVKVATHGAVTIDLRVEDGGDGPACDHADWAQAVITVRGGATTRLDELPQLAPPALSRYPFSFRYDGKSSDELLDKWPAERQSAQVESHRARRTTVWTDPVTGLRVHWDAVRFTDFPAEEWIVYFENTGKVDTPIIENVQALDLTFPSPVGNEYLLHKTNGAPSNPTDFEPSVVAFGSPQTGRTEILGGGGGRSSNKDLPFFKLESGRGSCIIAVGWSGQWQSKIEGLADRRLHVTAGLEKTHFLLHPGERVRSPRMLVLAWEGNTAESNGAFRRLIHEHYSAVRGGRKPQPTLFSNTCFTRGGAWLNECNAENQISLIRAYAPLGLEAVITDAGWFEGGWPAGAGNWTPRKDAYPGGMAPVAAAALERGLVYGLWFEPERVVAGTPLHVDHPEWLLASADGPQPTYLLNFGLPEAREHFFDIVRSFMELPGFQVYRQDCNIDPLPFWRHHDSADRQGIAEMKYIEGLYAFWDRIAESWPESLREECASGGRRIDLETIQRFHLHQDSDYWFDNDVDQAQIWGLSQYLPNNLFVAHLNRTDDYSFHSTLASSLCIGWIADGSEFDTERGKSLMDRYRAVRHLLTGEWYPLLPYSRSPGDWMASQYHRPDLDEGLILVFRHPSSSYTTVDLSLKGIDGQGRYEVTFDGHDGADQASSIPSSSRVVQGSELIEAFRVHLPAKGRSALITYRKRAP